MFIRNAALCSNMTWQHTYVNANKGLKKWGKVNMILAFKHGHLVASN